MRRSRKMMSGTPSVTLPGTVEKIIKPPNELEKTQITVKGADHPYREIRIDNTLRNENGGDAGLKPGVRVKVTIESDAGATTLLTMARTKPAEPLLEHEIRLR